ncbi:MULTISPECIES: hypothetical protein [unclassified Polynucleobacter]|uniref:hypothetical protein n=1 Tax=unclassified Polynucleobacter TaxID=2640945 RepID=UPI001BFE5BC9|nr:MULTISPECIES: hypothetical protein [unclassified Polynucleobacter]MBU3559374.1 hypothetical protein [Polynucleobacter sp. Nonnen-W13]QWE30087.1 hypothetical protein ICV89_07265 [Polynucleobacter sp. Adler-ghost]
MAIKLLQISVVRRLVVLLSPALLVACIASQPYPVSTPLPQPINPPQVRSPQVGQQWVYNVRNVFNQELVDIVTEKVVSVGPQVRIERSGLKAGPLPDEIQQPWGYIVQDPHWNPPQRFLQPIPLWPEQLAPGWSGFYRNRYQVLAYPDNDYYWGLNISAVGWEGVSTPAGQFPVLKYQSEAPYFTSNDFSRVANYRQEDVWLSPEIGRWVIRRSSGQYLWGGMSWAGALWEDYLEWELVSWK